MKKQWEYTDRGLCPYGGNCIDPGNPSDCQINSMCFNFTSEEEKTKFDNLPDRYKLVLRYKHDIYDIDTLEKINTEIKEDVIYFKNSTQVKFFIRDFERWEESILYILDDFNKQYFPITLGKNFTDY